MRKSWILLGLLTICLVLSACDRREPEPSREPTTAPTVFEIEDAVFTKTQVILSESEDSLGAPFGINKDLEMTEQNGNAYAFEQGISLYDREQCIRTTEAILARVGADKKLRIHIYTGETYGYTFIRNGAVYTCLQDWRAPEYLSAVLQGLFGEYCHYGTVYGYAGYLSNAVFGTPLNLCGADWVFAGDENVLDLNIFSFRGSLVAGKDVKAAKRIANTFAADSIGRNGETAFKNLLTRSGTPEGVDSFVKALSDFYASRNIRYTPSNILFRLGGKGYDYIVKCEYAVMHMERDWKDRNPAQLPMYYEGFLHRNYGEIIAYFTTIIRELGQYQNLFGLASYRNDLNIYYTNHYGNGKNAVYVPNSHAICSPYGGELAMCYIDSLIRDSVLQEDWAYNGMCAYFYWYYNDYGNRDMSYTVNLESSYDALKFYREFRNWMGRAIDMRTDFKDFLHYYAASKNFRDPSQGGSDSFVGYLITRFGEKQTIEILLKTHDFGEADFDELVADWKQFLKENYEQ